MARTPGAISTSPSANRQSMRVIEVHAADALPFGFGMVGQPECQLASLRMHRYYAGEELQATSMIEVKVADRDLADVVEGDAHLLHRLLDRFASTGEHRHILDVGVVPAPECRIADQRSVETGVEQ
jgi:hypothetical protein